MIGRRADTRSSTRYLPLGYDAIAKPRQPRAGEGANGRTPSQRRIFLALTIFAACFTLIGARLVGLAIVGSGAEGIIVAAGPTQVHRPDIVDRNGEVMATDIATASLFADGRYVIDPAETARQLVSVLPDLNVTDVTAKLASGKAFIWLKRDLTPKQQYAVHYLGLPGLDFRNEQKRVYPNGKTGSNVLGMVDLDNRGTAGIERYMDRKLGRTDAHDMPRFERGTTVMLSLDLHVQHALRDELEKAMVEFSALGAAGVIMDVHTGEVVAMTSLPDFDPNDPMSSSDETRFNRA
ncbi:MAG: penicillin-binding protein 2, partial [Parvibaculum sp.]|nr:penicillin-binding protein 2 [Parvibaculum sp.]